MIGKLTGRLDEIGPDWVVIDCGGVGYIAFCPGRTLDRLPGRGEPVSLMIETVVREDLIRLYGFMTAAERDWFRLLQTVQGVGAKVALALLTTLEPDALGRAIALQDKAAVARTPGIGPKLAQRIVLELKDKVPAGIIAELPGAKIAGPRAPKGPASEAVSALVNLGYGQSEAANAVAQALGEGGPDSTVETLIRAGLKELAR